MKDCGIAWIKYCKAVDLACLIHIPNLPNGSILPNVLKDDYVNSIDKNYYSNIFHLYCKNIVIRIVIL